jgi:ubiquinone/menaquinone biosynthesis C-methylase UbiE
MIQERSWEQWDAVAASMDAYWADTPVESWFRKSIASVLLPFAAFNTRICLDVGCGNGLLMKELIDAGANPRSLVGIDNSPSMLDRARARVPAGAFGLGDLYSLPYPDESVEVAWAVNLLSHIPNGEALIGLRNMWRVSSRAVFFTVLMGEKASSGAEFWEGHQFLKNAYTLEEVENLVSEACGPEAILVSARMFPSQGMVLFGAFKPNKRIMPARHAVILTSFNRSHMIKRAIRSVQAQTDQDWQMLIVDDGSNDLTMLSIFEEISGDPRITLLPCTEPSQDMIRADGMKRMVARINTGLKMASGSIIHYLADDDWYDAQRFGTFNALMVRADVKCAYGRVMLMNDTKVHGSVFPESPCKMAATLDFNQVAHRADTLSGVPAWVFDPEKAPEVRYFEEVARTSEFVGLDKIVAYKCYHPLNYQKTRERTTAVRET